MYTGCYAILDDKIGPTFTRPARFKVRFGFGGRAKNNIKEHFGDKKEFVKQIMVLVSKYFKDLGNRAIGRPIEFEVRAEKHSLNACFTSDDIFRSLIRYIYIVEYFFVVHGPKWRFSFRTHHD